MRLILSTLALLTAPALAQPSPPVCDTPDAAQFDFWLGTWELTWTDSEGGGRGINILTRTLDGCVIHERFESDDGYRGESVSVYDARTEQWRQTWVDNRGGYLLLSGGLGEDGVMELRTAPFTNPQTGEEQVNRMIWTGVSDNALTWRWQRSASGAAWEDRWVIHYARR